jgi:hypothetical protein
MSIRIVIVALALTASAQAQVIYEPVSVQYGGQNRYYYAGSDPQIHEAARFPSAPGAAWGRTNGYAFVSATRAVAERRARIFTDALGSFDARVYGMTVDDVVNEANARIPRYFSKADLLNQAAAEWDGTLRVSPYAPRPASPATGKGSIIIKPSQPPLFRRGPVIVIPKDMLDRKLADPRAAKGV